jgi:hypothetical protein
LFEPVVRYAAWRLSGARSLAAETPQAAQLGRHLQAAAANAPRSRQAQPQEREEGACGVKVNRKLSLVESHGQFFAGFNGAGQERAAHRQKETVAERRRLARAARRLDAFGWAALSVGVLYLLLWETRSFWLAWVDMIVEAFR